MILMCKDQEVWRQGRVIHEKLCPTILKNGAPIEDWVKLRQAPRLSNSSARLLRKKISGACGIGSDNMRVDFAIYCLSLSDCYWTKAIDEFNLFKNISPYFDKDWSKTGYAKGLSAPTVMVDGVYVKHWINSDYLFKAQAENEHEACTIARDLGFRVQQTAKTDKGVLIKNLTTPTRMLVQHLQLTGDTDMDMLATIETFGSDHFDTFLLDCILGNEDRHSGNLANYIDPDTGDNLGPSDIYDLDASFHHLPSMEDMLDQFMRVTKILGREVQVLAVCNRALKQTKPIVVENAKYLANRVQRL